MATDWWKKLTNTLLPAFLAVLLIAAQAQAHAYIESTVPAEGAVLASPPAQIHLVYTEPVEPKLTTLLLVDANDQPVAGVQQTSDGNRAFVLKLPPLASGVYSIKSQVLAKDGHVTEETVRFTVAGSNPAQAAVASPAPQAVAAPPAPAGGSPGTAVTFGAAIAVLALGGLLYAAHAARTRTKGQ